MKTTSKLYLFVTVFLLTSIGCSTQNETSTASNIPSAASHANVPIITQELPVTEDISAKNKPESTSTEASISEIPEDYYNDYQETGGDVALVVGVGEVLDNGYNEAAWEGAKTYAQAAGVSYSFYTTATDSPKAYEQTALNAIQNNAQLLVCAGPHFEQAVGKLQNQYPNVTFLLLDGIPKDETGSETEISKNVLCITYNEEEAGYLAGYITVLDGYRNFGFIGGEQLPSVERFGYGFLQGIDDAAASMNINHDISVKYWYSGTFLPSAEIEKRSNEWYQNGTEIIFACGGSLYQSVLAAAQTCDGMIIGVDSDQSDISERFLTSAMKGVHSSVIAALDEYYAYGKKWPEELAGTVISYDSSNKGITLPLSDNAWRFQNVTLEDYFTVFHELSAGTYQVSDDITSQPDVNITVTYYND